MCKIDVNTINYNLNKAFLFYNISNHVVWKKIK